LSRNPRKTEDHIHSECPEEFPESQESALHAEMNQYLTTTLIVQLTSQIHELIEERIWFPTEPLNRRILFFTILIEIYLFNDVKVNLMQFYLDK
jgi:hypothetical protein